MVRRARLHHLPGDALAGRGDGPPGRAHRAPRRSEPGPRRRRDDRQVLVHALGHGPAQRPPHLQPDRPPPGLQRPGLPQGILDAVESLIGPNIQLHHTKLNLKPPASGQARFEWHQDYPFFPHTNYDLVAVAVHIDEATTENGCLRVIPGIHKGGPREHAFSADGAFSSQLKDQSYIPDESHWLNVTSPAGGVEMHHCNMLHSSTANRGTKPRSAVIIQYRAADNVQLSPDWPDRPGFGMQIRGVNPYQARLLDGTIVPLPTRSRTRPSATADGRAARTVGGGQAGCVPRP